MIQKELTNPAPPPALDVSFEGHAKPAQRQIWTATAASLGLIGILTVAGAWLAPVIRPNNLAILYTCAVLFNAVLWGRHAAVVSAVSGAVLFDILFMPTDAGAAISGIRYLIPMAGFLAAGFIATAPGFGKTSRAHETDKTAIDSLYDEFTSSLASENDPDRILDAITRYVTETFKRPTAMLLPGPAGLAVHFRSPELILDDREKSIAAWVFEKGEDAGCGRPAFPDSKIRYRPLKTRHGVVGVLGIRVNDRNEPLPDDQQELLGAFINLAALALTRADLAGKAQRAELLQETDRLQKALLNSVSHDLRTPLVSIIGGLNSVIHDAALLDASTQQALLTTARDEAVRLNRLIQNLLDMTRLETGAILAKAEPYDVHDVVGAALEQLGEAARHREISIRIEPALPLVPMDQALIVQVLVNLLDNALKYSPADSPIGIDARRLGNSVEIRVANSGKEIAREELDRVFDKFFRGSSAGSSRGIGLGLAICKGFVEAHHGRIRAEGRREGGIEISFSLPLGSKT